MYSRTIKPPNNKSFFLFGPRGTGKSTWVQKVFADNLYLDLLESELYNLLIALPQRLESFIPPGYEGWVIIDEIQRIPELLNEVHRLIEKRNLFFVLTGSSARKLRRKGVNLLAGRALTRRMHPLTVIELGGDFTLDHSLQWGHMPMTFTDSNPAAYLSSYVHTYLREEVQQEGLTRNLQAFARFLEAASFSQAAPLNISEVARECDVNRKLAEEYFNIIEDLLLSVRLPAFRKCARRRVVAHPKFFLFDTGFYRAIRPKGILDRPE
jgi:predicted AAA+ superfamily ATPase